MLGNITKKIKNYVKQTYLEYRFRLYKFKSVKRLTLDLFFSKRFVEKRFNIYIFSSFEWYLITHFSINN